MHVTIYESLAMAWGAFALLVIFALKYGTGKREHPSYDQRLLIGYLITATVTIWPLMAAPSWRPAAIALLTAEAVGLLMIGLGTILERTGKKARIPTDTGGQFIGRGGAVAIVGLLLGLVLLTVAASSLGAAAPLQYD